jgi:hypothetical protein
MAKSSDANNDYNKYVIAAIKTNEPHWNSNFDGFCSVLVDFPRYRSDFTHFLKEMRNRLSSHSISPNKHVPSFEASELKGFMDADSLFDRRTDGSEPKDGIAC